VSAWYPGRIRGTNYLPMPAMSDNLHLAWPDQPASQVQFNSNLSYRTVQQHDDVVTRSWNTHP
jgi:hypothetical protein